MHEDLKLARRAILRAANPKLTQVSETNHSRVAAAKNIRAELAAAFPGVKFSVRGRTASMMDAIDVSWTDGPMTAQVDEIIGKYAAGSFNGMDDSYNYSVSVWNDCFGDAKYVSGRRDHSAQAEASAVRRVFAKYGQLLAELGQTEEQVLADWQSGKGLYVQVGGCQDVRDLIWQSLSRHTAFAKPVKTLAVWPDFQNEEVSA